MGVGPPAQVGVADVGIAGRTSEGGRTVARTDDQEVLVEQGRKCNALYIILVGRTRVLMTDNNGREVILATLSSGDYVGEMSLIDNECWAATVSCDA